MNIQFLLQIFGGKFVSVFTLGCEKAPGYNNLVVSFYGGVWEGMGANTYGERNTQRERGK